MMFPDWLKVPAATQASAASSPMQAAPSQWLGFSGAPGLWMGSDDAWPWRLALFLASEAPADDASLGQARWEPRSLVADPGLARLLAQRRWAGIEVIGPAAGGPSPKVATLHPSAFHGAHMSGGTGALDRHQLDVALSVGRHVAERAKLARMHGLVSLGEWVWPSGLPGLGTVKRAVEPAPGGGRTSPRRAAQSQGLCPQSAYDRLMREASFVQAALVGCLVACAQMGMVAGVGGRGAMVAAGYADALCLGAETWISVAVPGRKPAMAGERRRAQVQEARAVRVPRVR